VPTVIKYENWDGVTAPAIPFGWSVSTPIVTTASPGGGIGPISSPNVLACPSQLSATNWAAVWGTVDGAGGNVLVQASFNAASVPSQQGWGVFARASASTLGPGTDYYWALLSTYQQKLYLYSAPAGILSSIGTVYPIVFSSGEWYTVSLTCNVSTISVTVTRAADGYYLTGSGSWQSAQTTAISATNGAITGSGYAGLTLQSEGADSYSDDWYLYNLAGSPPPPPQAPPVRALPIVQRARGRGQVIQPWSARFGTPILPPASGLRSGIVSRDVSRRIASTNRGRVWLSVPPPVGVPTPIPFAFWRTIQCLDQSELRRHLAPGRASTPQSFARLAPPPQIPFVFWQTVKRIDQSELRRRTAPGRVWYPNPTVVPGGQVYEGFTQQYITSVNAPVQYGTEVFLSWTSDIPAASDLVYQVYENDVLVWHGTSTYCTLPLPAYTVRFDIGTVGFTQQGVSFASLLPPAPRLQAELTWLGGTFEAPDIAGFHIYGEVSPGGGINYTSVLATIPAYTAGIVTDGFGEGGFGEGGFGESAGSYSWISNPLHTGDWTFGVVPFDTNGNEGTGATTIVPITAPPGEPIPFPDRSRLHYAYDNVTYEAVLSWNASPG